MPILRMMKGLPGSGKTTIAQGSDYAGYVRVNKDDIREELAKTGWGWSPENEKDVIAVRDARIKAALRDGKNVVSDDTNLAPKHERNLREIAAAYGAAFGTDERLLNTPYWSVAECIRRDSLRTDKAPVGVAVIRGMAERYLRKKLTDADYEALYPEIMVPYREPTGVVARAIICDLDGTVALHRGRSPYATHLCHTDDVNPAVALVLSMYDDDWAGNSNIVYMTGRDEQFRDMTQKWMRDHKLPTGELRMRPEGDTRKDWIVKGELFTKHIRQNYNVDFCLDDRNQVVNYWRKIGLTCFQVAPGDF